MANKILYESHASSDSVVNVKFDRKRSNIRYQLFYWQFWVEEWSCEEKLIFILIVTVLMGKQVLEREEGWNWKNQNHWIWESGTKLKNHLLQLLICAGNSYSVLSRRPRSSPTIAHIYPFDWVQFFVMCANKIFLYPPLLNSSYIHWDQISTKSLS